MLAISTIRAWSIFSYSIWNVEEEQIVMHALGFLDYNFNPGWFEYHTLPMYVVSGHYFSAYYALLFSCAYTLGCYVIAYGIAKC